MILSFSFSDAALPICIGSSHACLAHLRIAELWELRRQYVSKPKAITIDIAATVSSIIVCGNSGIVGEGAGFWKE